MSNDDGSVEDKMFSMPARFEDAPEIFRQVLKPKEIEFFMRMTDDTIAEYKDVFDIFDESGDGDIDGGEIE